MTRRLLISYLGLVLLALAGLEIPFGYIYARGELARFSHSVERDAVMVAELAEEEIEEGNIAELPSLARDYARRTRGRVVIVDRYGTVLADSDPTTATDDNLSAEPDIAAALRGRQTAHTREDPATGAEVLYATMPGSSGSTVRGAVRLIHPISAVTERVHAVWLALALAGGCVLAAVALIAFALARWITRPVRALEHATAQLADGNLADLPPDHLGPPELRRLAGAFTRTATRLQHLLHAQRSFAAEASHQLKTPLTALRIRLENFEPHLDPHAHDSLDEAIAEVERLARMVHGLLALARLEHSATAPQAVDLDAVLADRSATWTAFAAEQHVRIAVDGRPAGRVRAVPGALEQIIDNLLANALRVAPPGSTITLARRPATLTGGAFGAELHVIDEGPGMTAEERERAFDPFWRAGAAHHDGTGLGLPIVRRLARAGGGEVTLRRAPGGGLDATVCLVSAIGDPRWITEPSPAAQPRDRPHPAASPRG